MNEIENYLLYLIDRLKTLPEAVDFALDYLFPMQSFHDESLMKLTLVLQRLSKSIESHGASLARIDEEPAYHNRQHAIDVVVALVFLIGDKNPFEHVDLNIKQHSYGEVDSLIAWPNFSAREKILLLMAAIGHDFKHPGGVNQKSAEFEFLSANAVAELLLMNRVSHLDVEFVQSLILATEFSQVPELHAILEQYNNSIPPLLLRASIVLTEADVLPSILPGYGRVLANKLSNEWIKLNLHSLEDPSTEQAYQKFLRKVRFSSPYAKRFHLDKAIKSQLKDHT